ncbi:uncharacterized protein LOC132744825 isoform X2 [Ruditapes philippinarum]|uniref:uncharacterized protein LOC132744825 isoform X2 n=2 Tax=Ruditapes philippinarum TaxID=129788 RepID=UPI00295AFF9F|nr:uncharacterized protein LOC132744825 isoform X2 [Ruditapes philippinarum]
MVNFTPDSDMTDCCSKCGSHANPRFTASEMALTSVLSFIAGVALIVLVFFIIKLERNKKMCFRKKEEPFKGKFEGASQKATIKVLKKHTLERSSGKSRANKEDQKLDIESANITSSPEVQAAVVNTEVETKHFEEVMNSEEIERNEIKNKQDTENRNTENIPPTERKEIIHEQKIEKIESENEEYGKGNNETNDVSIVSNQGNSGESNCHVETNGQIETEVAPVINLLRSENKNVVSSQLFEKSRGSSVYEHEDLVFQNDNFRISALSNI